MVEEWIFHFKARNLSMWYGSINLHVKASFHSDSIDQNLGRTFLPTPSDGQTKNQVQQFAARVAGEFSQSQLLVLIFFANSGMTLWSIFVSFTARLPYS